MITQQEARRLFWYRPETGEMYWRHAPANNTKPWDRAGSTRGARKRLCVKIKAKDFFVHRIAWIYVNGDIPDGHFVDHISRDEGDNRIENLRLTTHAENCQNRIYSKASNDVVGVYPHKSGGWVARICVNGKQHHLGAFRAKEDAVAARAAAVASIGKYHLVHKRAPKDD